ncbi:hypothetical protein [Rhodopila sp.]|uniref:hypothetical protein n=1 Tax=Rhodopila sp. TaxID=2480087 RepID=UPI003D0AC9C9
MLPPEHDSMNLVWAIVFFIAALAMRKKKRPPGVIVITPVHIVGVKKKSGWPGFVVICVFLFIAWAIYS